MGAVSASAVLPSGPIEAGKARLPKPTNQVFKKAQPMIDLSNKEAVSAASDEEFEAARKAQPGASLRFEHAFDRLTDAQFEASIDAAPDAAKWLVLKYEHACAIMTDAQFEAFCAAEPDAVTEFDHVRERIERIALAVEADKPSM